MRMTRSIAQRWLTRWMRVLRLALSPRHALPCVGLVVLGGCLTFIITPDEKEGTGDPQVWEQKGEFPLVILDPGHGGRDEGTSWRGVTERELTLDLAFRVQRLLKGSGFHTMMTRQENVYLSLDERTRLANAQKNALFISLHYNSENTSTSSGIETYFPRSKEVPVTDWSFVGIFNKGETIPTDSSENLAGAIQSSLINRTEARNRGIHPSNFYVIHHTRCPSVLVEAGFISNVFESQLLSTEVYRETLAQGIVEGVLNYQRNRIEETPRERTPEQVRQ